MKKILAIMILFAASAGVAVFAQSTTAVTIDLRTDALYKKSYLDDYKKTNAGEFKIFNGHGLADPGFILGVEFKYDGPDNKYGGKLWLPLISEDNPALGIKAGAYAAWIRLGPKLPSIPLLKIYAGNDDLNGLTDNFRFNVFYEWYFMRPDSIEPVNFGVIMPYNPASGGAAPEYTFLDNNNLGKKPNGVKPELGLPGVNLMTDINIGPVTVSLSNLGSFFYQTKPSKDTEEIDIDFGVRAGFANVRGITLEAAYKHSSRSRENSAIDTKEVLVDNAAGIYGGFNPRPDLGIGIGYSVFFQTKTDNGDAAYTNPLYHAVDLRSQFTGINNVKLTFNNNASFSFVNGDDDSGTIITGVPLGGTVVPDMGKDTKEYYFVYTGAFSGSYMFSEELTADLQFAVQTGLIKLEEPVSDQTNSKTLLSAYVGASYKINNHISIRGGFSMKSTFDDASASDSAKNMKGGVIETGIPLAVRLFF
ncbi:hypothetical protein AGMMS4952_20350 [Spirochaetia bacterium]|nr:hypothetical protein AGMMS4952_20350 [Spirochaetia bacterium]